MVKTKSSRFIPLPFPSFIITRKKGLVQYCCTQAPLIYYTIALVAYGVWEKCGLHHAAHASHSAHAAHSAGTGTCTTTVIIVRKVGDCTFSGQQQARN